LQSVIEQSAVEAPVTSRISTPHPFMSFSPQESRTMRAPAPVVKTKGDA
jgi:hypothetical protein